MRREPPKQPPFELNSTTQLLKNDLPEALKNEKRVTMMTPVLWTTNEDIEKLICNSNNNQDLNNIMNTAEEQMAAVAALKADTATGLKTVLPTAAILYSIFDASTVADSASVTTVGPVTAISTAARSAAGGAADSLLAPSGGTPSLSQEGSSLPAGTLPGNTGDCSASLDLQVAGTDQAARGQTAPGLAGEFLPGALGYPNCSGTAEEEMFRTLLLRAGGDLTSIAATSPTPLRPAPAAVKDFVRHKIAREAGHLDDKSIFVYNIRTMHRNIQLWKEMFPEIGLLYPLLANGDTALLETAVLAGIDGFVAAFPGNWAQLQNASASVELPGLLVYDGGMGKTTAARDAARLAGATTCVVDTLDDLQQQLLTYWDSPVELKMMFRLAGSSRRLGGLPRAQWETAIEHLREAAANAKREGCLCTVSIGGIKIDGVNPMVKTNENYVGWELHLKQLLLDVAAFYETVMRCGSDLVNSKFLINLGCVPLVPSSAVCEVEAYRSITKDFVRLYPHVILLAEPAPFFLEDVGFLATRVFARRHYHTESSVLYYICDGIYHNLGSKVYEDVQFHPTVLARSNAEIGAVANANATATATVNEPETETDGATEAKMPCKIFGQTCDGFDCVIDACDDLPLLSIGDWLWFEDQGNNGNIVTNFNGFDVGSKLYCCI